ncbi:hypothetical protein BCR33DRAFT_154258 [Rhizoclosmatium globosum]|uniref:Uncharacterized protein n=1 Tax=Rhizoclosmatium globosum TaxID=329046 RepID=A0A1Y2CFP5_9FUNG|nr:hypothetical protein BCR33DRAFT_154258 [Rhizoclosmatium globosum]|eukprot:ORY45871.1 hypothetical protein BCR33DRAFT_154258 [Rhizoclosmatium globosum]
MRLITILICAISTQAVVLFLTINLLHYSGGAPDIFMSTGYTLENCQNYCLAAQSNNPPCVAVSFYTPPSSSTGTCYAKSQGGIDSGSSVAFDAGWRFSFYKYQVTTLYGLSFNGYTTSSVTGNTKEECVASCLQLTTCRSVLFSDSNGCVGKEYLNFNILANGYLIIVGRSLTTTTSTTTSTKTSTTSSSTSTATTSTTSKVITSDTSTTSSSTSTTTTSATSSTMSSTTSSSPIDTGTSRTTTTTIYSRISVAVTVTTADIAIPFSSATSSSFALTTTETLKLPSTSTQFVAIKISTETASSFTSIHSITASATSITTEATTIPSLTSLYTFTAQLFTNSGSSTFRTSVCTPSSSSSSVSECTSISCSSPTSLSRTEQTFSSKGTSGFFITHVATTSTFSSTYQSHVPL